MSDIGLRRVYDEPGPDDGYRVLVDRLWPRGMSHEHARVDEWCRDVAPSNELREWFGHDPAKWQGFVERYRAELAGNAAVEPLVERAVAGRLTLVYGARDTEHNQAVVLRDVLAARLAQRGAR